MAVFGTSDLHLSFGVDKPMNVFGEKWNGYEEKLKANWQKQVRKEDIVIIVGDISWGLNFKEAKKDFEYINALPGTKIIIRGNHDYYFSTKTKVDKFLSDSGFDSIKTLHNNSLDTDKYILCGTRGWGITEDKKKEDDEKIISRETGRLRMSLEQGKRIQEEYSRRGIKKEILAAIHFPPFIPGFQELLKEYDVKKCIYGHLHGYGHSIIKEGLIDNTEYTMVGCDYNNFKLVEL